MRLILTKNLKLLVFQILTLAFSLLITQASGQDLRIKISSGQVEPLPIAIADFTGQ